MLALGSWHLHSRGEHHVTCDPGTGGCRVAHGTLLGDRVDYFASRDLVGLQITAGKVGKRERGVALLIRSGGTVRAATLATVDSQAEAEAIRERVDACSQPCGRRALDIRLEDQVDPAVLALLVVFGGAGLAFAVRPPAGSSS